MNISEVLGYLSEKGIMMQVQSIEPITVGASGAKLFHITADNKRYVLKVAHESFHHNQNMQNSYLRELAFNQTVKHEEFPFIPKVIYAEHHPKYGVILVMERYSSIPYKDWTVTMQKKAMDVCAAIHSISPSRLESLHLQRDEVRINEADAYHSFLEWCSVMQEHEGKFSKQRVEEIYNNIEIVCPILNKKPHDICHGDFHPDNLLYDGNQIYVCDWQGINIGKGIGDFSFFITRGTGFGLELNEAELLEYYCERLSLYKGESVDKNTIWKERYAASLLTTFLFWAEYLHHSTWERVAEPYQEMLTAYEFLLTK